MRAFLLIFLVNFSLFAQFPPKPGGGGFPGGGPKPPSMKKPDIGSQVQKALASNAKQMLNLNKQFASMKKKLLEGNQRQLTQLLGMAKKAGNQQLTQLLNNNLKTIASQLLSLNSGSSSGDSSSSDSSDESSDSEEESDEEESDESDEETSETAKAENKDFPLGRWYQTKSHFTLQSGGEGIDSNGDRFTWTRKGSKVTIKYAGKVVRVYINTDKREILGLDRKRTRGVYEGN